MSRQSVTEIITQTSYRCQYEIDFPPGSMGLELVSIII